MSSQNVDQDVRKVIKVGSRKSELALIQTKYVISCLQKLFPTIKWEIHHMTTVGDRVLNKSLPKIGEKSLFTKDLEDALVHGGVDFVVHSLKDLPTQLPCGMTIGAVLEREDPRDALVLNSEFVGHTLQTLPAGSLIGTSSLRRTAQLYRNFTHLKVCDIRGNLNTRLAKLDAPQSKFSGIILANAGLVRMGWTKRVNQIIESDELLYAVGQGALAVECRANDTFVLNLLSRLCDFKTQCRILAERSFLKTLGGGCSAPVGINSVIVSKSNSIDNEYELNVNGGVWSLDGSSEIVDKDSTKFTVQCDIIDIKESDEDEVDVTPKKRPKLSSDEEEKPNKSPEVIDDSASSYKGQKDASELVNIHGKMFESCPFSGQLKNDSQKNPKEGRKFDLATFPIGQDFMGECPVLNLDQKVAGVDGGGDVARCPMTGKTVVSMNATTDEIEKCPYLLIDYEENAKTNPKCEQKSLVDNVADMKLYCGFFCHKESLRSAFDKCEELGVSLANKLISAGALEIMKVAQDEIHSKIN